MKHYFTPMLWAFRQPLFFLLLVFSTGYSGDLAPKATRASGLFASHPASGSAKSVPTYENSSAHLPAASNWLSINEDPGFWQVVTPSSGSIIARHESAFVEVNGKFYLLGGRYSRPVQMYDPVTKVWTTKANAPLELNHFQAVAYNGLIYVINAFTGTYPHETPVPNIYLYNPSTNAWSVGPAIPAARQRGSSSVVVYNNKFYIFCGIQDGHYSGWVTWTDEYNPATNVWTTLPDAPRARDHAQAALIGTKVYLAGGRRSSGITNQVFQLTVPQVDCYDLVTKQWTTLPNNIPTQRAGAATAVLGNEVIVIGGESYPQGTAHVEAEALNVSTQTWRSLDTLLQGRHGTQAIVNSNKIYIAAGSAKRGGGPELSEMEMYQPGSTPNQAPVVSNAIPSQTATIGTPYSFTVAANTFSDPEGNALTYSANLSTNAALPSWLSFNAGTRTFSGTPPSGSASPLSIKVTASDGQLTTSTTFSLSINPASTATPLYLINAGGPTVTTGGKTWSADQYYSLGNTNVQSGVGDVANTTDDVLYYSERYRTDFSYNIPVPAAGTYTVKLHFAEIHFVGALAGTGKRIFNVALEGQPVLTNFDINAEAGPGPKALIKTFTTQVTDGKITVAFTTVKDNAKLSAIEVYSGSGTTNQAPVVSQAIPNQSATIGTPFSFTFAANTFSDPEGSALTYSASLSDNTALPAWLSFNTSTRTFSGTPPSSSPASLSLKVNASDGQLTTSTTFSLTINPASSGQQVVSFTLINADTDADLQTLTNGATLNLATLPTKNLNVRANTNPAKVGSVLFNLTGQQTRTVAEGGAPYALFGDNAGNYNAWVPAVGSYTLKGTPFSAGGGTGTAGTALTVSFSVINQAARLASETQELITPQLVAYPNPVTDGRFTVSLSEAYQGPVSYVLVYQSGAVLTREQLSVSRPSATLTFDFSKQMGIPGIYYLRLEGKNLRGFLKLQRQ